MALRWFRAHRLACARRRDRRRLLDDPELDVLYLAVPHHLHEELYLDAIAPARTSWARSRSGSTSAPRSGSWRRCKRGRAVRALLERDARTSRARSSPTTPSAVGGARPADRGRHAFLHSSDLDRAKPINWKRQASTAASIGVMGDLGMHVAAPAPAPRLAAGRVHAVLQDIVTERPGPDGTAVHCDTWDNAMLHADAGGFPLTLQMKRIAPGGETNTWRLRAPGMDGGVDSRRRARRPCTALLCGTGGRCGKGSRPGANPRSPRSPARSSSSGSPTPSCRCGRRTWPSAPARWATASAAPRRSEALDAHRVFDAALRSGQTHRAEPV